MNYRFYSIVAGLYLSDLQKGLQTAHAVSEVFTEASKTFATARALEAFKDWAASDKTIIILSAGNHGGVVSAYETLRIFASLLDLPIAAFKEDEQSMNCMCTACGIIVPEKYWNVRSELNDQVTAAMTGNKVAKYVSDDYQIEYWPASPEYELIKILKSYPLA